MIEATKKMSTPKQDKMHLHEVRIRNQIQLRLYFVSLLKPNQIGSIPVFVISKHPDNHHGLLIRKPKDVERL